jgi:hypothetical protein
MKKVALFATIFQFFSWHLNAQSNCANPLSIAICPSVYLANQTNAGMGDDATGSCNITGEDVVYEISAPDSTVEIFVSIVNASDSLQLSLETSFCGNGVCSLMVVPPGNSNIIFNVVPANLYYLWVDASDTVTYDISFGGDTASTLVNIPDTQGNLQFDSACASPPFQNSKPFFQVSYNGVYQTQPMTLSPLFTTGVMCITTYFKNTTGVEGIRQFIFSFGSGYSSVVAQQDTFPGNYNSGNWIGVQTGNVWTFNFIDSAGTGKGDFTGTPDTCLQYNFCFDVIPVSNDTQLTNVFAEITSDGFGTGFSGLVSSGCCPIPFANCLAGGGMNPSTHSFSFNFNDPGGSTGLPIELLEFGAEVTNEEYVRLKWITASETNNDYFLVEKSKNAKDWKQVDKVNGAGNSSATLHYESLDKNPFPGVSYYRLKQTDYDGRFSYSNVVSVNIHESPEIKIYPNPTRSQFILNLTSHDHMPYTFILYDLTGREIEKQINVPENENFIFGKNLLSGFYLAKIILDGESKVLSLIKN